LIISGHTHVQRKFELEGILAINPGSLVTPKNGATTGYILLEIDNNKILNINFVEY
jgi:putative phosphoesterase